MKTYKNYGFKSGKRDIRGKLTAKIVLESQGYTNVKVNKNLHGDDIKAISPEGEQIIAEAKANKHVFQLFGGGGTKENPIPMEKRLLNGWKRALIFVVHHITSDKCYIIPTSIIKKSGQKSVSLGGPKWEPYCVGTLKELLV